MAIDSVLAAAFSHIEGSELTIKPKKMIYFSSFCSGIVRIFPTVINY